MKNYKKIASLLLAVLLICALAAPTYAATADLSGHTYVTYQIFSGTQAVGNDRLAQVEWGSGIDGAAFLTALKSSSAFGSPNAFAACVTAKDVTVALSAFSDGSSEAKAFAKLAYQNRSGVSGGTTSLAAGEYLVVDTTAFAAGATNTVRNLALIQLTQKGNFDINNKVSIPEVEKKVLDQNDSTGAPTAAWQDSADADIGDSVAFQLTATLASIADYDTYQVIFHDTLAAGLTYQGITSVKIDGIDKTASFNAVISASNLTVSCADVKAIGATDDSTIVVEYTAELSANAVIGRPGNPNQVYLEYSNNPNESGLGANETGNTPVDQVSVFTYQVIVNKTDENNTALVGATFELLKYDGANYVSLSTIDGTALSKFVWTGVDDGMYRLHEVAAPNGYNKIDDIDFTVTATHDIVSATPGLLTLTGTGLFQGDPADGSVTATVQNEPGVTLPETGGIGTTIFYVLGSLMLLGATVILVARKRTNRA